MFATPEPDLTPQHLIDRAVALRPMLLDQQDEADERGYYSASVHDAFRQAGAGHALIVGAHWSEQAQRDIFGKENGHVVCPHRAPPGGTARKVDGG